ncbi:MULTISPECIES: hypothetical protein [unclassified Rhizobacter]|uniref:hypothetical protein n=1 Tax=unclassified Rhizobacter TaxID=2640088 RepID=UPI0012F8FC4D|nr:MULTISPECIES: hypothetical protein [unclassified Rhizobacter]
MKASSPRLVALGFYDGPTEGFVRGVESGFAHYFKAVAWDDDQDRRLYLLGRVEERVVDQLLALLAEPGQAISSAVFTPAWAFGDAQREALANKLVEEGRRTLNSPALVVLGSSLLDSWERLFSPTVPNPVPPTLRGF